jgi:hypothetical protein
MAKVGASVLVIDFSQAMIRQARQRTGGSAIDY